MIRVLEIARRAPRAAQAALPLACALALAACGGPGGAPQDDPAAALDAALAGRRLHPQEPFWSYRQAQLLAAAGSAAPARAHLDTALALDPGYEPAVALLSKLHYEAGRHEAAADLLRSHLARHPQADHALRAALALNLDALGAWEEADSVLATCAADDAGAVQVRAYLAVQGDDLEAAAQAADRAVDAAPASAAARNNQGIALLYAGRPDEARAAFLAALEHDPALPGAMYNLAIVETFYFDDREAGRDWFARYRELASDDPDDLAAALDAPLTTAQRKETP